MKDTSCSPAGSQKASGSRPFRCSTTSAWKKASCRNTNPLRITTVRTSIIRTNHSRTYEIFSENMGDQTLPNRRFCLPPKAGEEDNSCGSAEEKRDAKLNALRAEIKKGTDDLEAGRFRDGPTAMAELREKMLR